jgi:hypothetical protein
MATASQLRWLACEQPFEHPPQRCFIRSASKSVRTRMLLPRPATTIELMSFDGSSRQLRHASGTGISGPQAMNTHHRRQGGHPAFYLGRPASLWIEALSSCRPTSRDVAVAGTRP